MRAFSGFPTWAQQASQHCQDESVPCRYQEVPLTDSKGFVGSTRGNQGAERVPADGTNAGDTVVNKGARHTNRTERTWLGPVGGIVVIAGPERTHTCGRRRCARLWYQSRPGVERR